MPRHPQPREHAELKGATKKHPDRYRTEVPKSDAPLGNAPEHLSDKAKACWFEIESYAIPNVMTGADRIALEVLSNLLAEYRDGPKEFTAAKLNQLMVSLGRFGMTPSDRNKLGVEKTKKANPFDNLDD